MIVGAKGGRLELVLNTVFHLGQPIENIPWDFYKEFTIEGVTGAKRPGKYSHVVDVAVPYCLGDNFKGYRVVGTTPALFHELGYSIDDDGKPVPYRFSPGECFAPRRLLRRGHRQRGGHIRRACAWATRSSRRTA